MVAARVYDGSCMHENTLGTGPHAATPCAARGVGAVCPGPATAGADSHLNEKRWTGGRPVNPRVMPASSTYQAAFGVAFQAAGIVIAATPITTQTSPIQAVGARCSPRNSTPIATPIGTRM